MECKKILKTQLIFLDPSLSNLDSNSPVVYKWIKLLLKLIFFKLTDNYKRVHVNVSDFPFCRGKLQHRLCIKVSTNLALNQLIRCKLSIDQYLGENK